MATMVVESACSRVVAGFSPVGQSGSSESRTLVGACSVFLPVLRTSLSMQVGSTRSGAGNHFSRTSFGSSVSSPSTVKVVAQSALADSPSLPKKPVELHTVGDFMTRLDDLFVVGPDTSVDEALEILVEKRITGLPVVNDEGRLIGVVSDYDLLALDSISGKRSNEGSLFPAANSTWKAFKEIQSLLGKTIGKTVGELMSPSPLSVREMTNIEDAARILLETKYRRLPVLNEAGKLVGLLTRGNVVKAALEIKRAHEKSAA